MQPFTTSRRMYWIISALTLLTLGMAVSAPVLNVIARNKQRNAAIQELHSNNIRVGLRARSGWLESLLFSEAQRMDVYKIHATGITCPQSLIDKLYLFQDLEELEISYGEWSAEDLSRLPRLERLKYFYATGVPLSNTGLHFLSKFPNLVFLDLQATEITSNDLVTMPELPELIVLLLDGSSLSRADFERLAELPSLESLFLSEDYFGSQISDKDREWILEKFPNIIGPRRIGGSDGSGKERSDRAADEIRLDEDPFE